MKCERVTRHAALRDSHDSLGYFLGSPFETHGVVPCTLQQATDKNRSDRDAVKLLLVPHTVH